MTRRELLRAGLPLAAALVAPRRARSAPEVEIRMRSDARGERVGFDPVGLAVEPGTVVRWVLDSPGNPHTTTAYHPRNARHSLRIPPGAEPWDSGFLVNPGDRFAVRLAVEGVYDYFCLPHEAAGMVGRIVVGRPSGPGALPFDYFAGRADARDWLPVPPAARRSFPTVAEIVARRTVPLPAFS